MNHMPVIVPRMFRPLAQRALAQGWTIEKTSKSHLRWQAPTGEVVFTASTPSDRRVVMNVRSDLRRRGLVL